MNDSTANSTAGKPDMQEAYFGHQHLTVIEPTKGWRTLDLRELWAYRELLWVLTARDVKVRYTQTSLGVLWALIQPVMMMLVFTLLFSRLAKISSDGLPYPVFVFAALLPWTFFASAVGNAGNSLVGSSHLISKVYFPRLIIPLASIGAWLLDFAIATLLLLAMMLWYGIGWTWQLLAVPLLVLGVIFAALGVGTLLSALTVAYRDFRYVIPLMLQLWMYATPVAYPSSAVPPKWQWLIHLNPMAGLIEGFRSAFLGLPFDWVAIAISVASAMAIFVIGIAYFERVERGFADVI